MYYIPIFANIGLISILIILGLITKRFVLFLYEHYLGQILHRMDFKARGKWALVTGCTDGIGKEYAKHLAARGCDIVLVSRSLVKLEETAAEIKNEYKVDTKIVQVDFSEGDHIYEEIKQAIADLEIGTLVNNVGMSYPYPEYYLDVPDCDDLMTAMIKTNITSVVKMTGMILPDMVKREKGIIINIGSASSIIPSPLLTGYAATKAFVDKFSEGLEMEYGKNNILIQCIMPGFVCSNMSGIRRSTIMSPTPKTFVSAAIKTVGCDQRTTGYVPHTFFVYAVNLFYILTGNIALWLVTRSMENNRRKAMKKYKRQ